MAKLRLVQNGATSTRPLIVIYHCDSSMDDRIRTACGSYPCIVNYTARPMKGDYARVGKQGLESLKSVYESIRPDVGAVAFTPVIVAGFSEGCQGVRAQLYEAMTNTGAMTPDGIVCIDGVHSSKPIPEQPDGYTQGDGSAFDLQMQPWLAWLGGRSQWGDDTSYGAVFSHSEIEPGTYTSVRHTLERIFGVQFGKGADEHTPALHRTGNIDVWSFPGKEAKDHSHQLRFVMPHGLNRVLCQLGELQENGPEEQRLNELLKKPQNADPNLDPKKPKVDPDPKPKPDPRPKPKPSGSSAPLVIGLAVGGVAVVGGVAYYVHRRKRRT